MSSAGESGEAKQSRPATKDREATINSPASPRKDKRLLLILQAKSVKKIDGVELSPEQQKSLAAGEVVRVENAVNSAGEKQTVYVRWNTEKGNPDFFRSIPADSNKNRK